MASKYDDLLNRYHTIATTKQGTRYEVLAAMVAKTLEDSKRVVHDLKLRGDSDVKHQIDVTVEDGSATKNLLIECKDFDVSGDKVGLSIVRDFWAVVDDTKPQAAWIMSCNGFTSEALKFAKAKGIKPIVMRLFREEDLHGRITKIIINFKFRIANDPKVDLFVDDIGQKILEDAMQAAGIGAGISLLDDAYFVSPDGTRTHFNDVVRDETYASMGDQTAGMARSIVHPNGRRLLIGGTDVPYKGIVIDYGILTETTTREIVSQRTAELILNGIGDADMIIYDDQLRQRSIDPGTGEIK